MTIRGGLEEDRIGGGSDEDKTRTGGGLFPLRTCFKKFAQNAMCIEAWRDGIVVWYWYTNVSYLRHLPPPVAQHPGPRFHHAAARGPQSVGARLPYIAPSHIAVSRAISRGSDED